MAVLVAVLTVPVLVALIPPKSMSEEEMAMVGVPSMVSEGVTALVELMGMKIKVEMAVIRKAKSQMARMVRRWRERSS